MRTKDFHREPPTGVFRRYWGEMSRYEKNTPSGEEVKKEANHGRGKIGLNKQTPISKTSATDGKTIQGIKASWCRANGARKNS